MSGVRFAVTTAEIALTAATAKTVLQIVAAANHRIHIQSWGFWFDGVSTTAEPVQARLLKQTTAGTMSAATPVKVGTYDETLQVTAQHTATAEPTASDVYAVKEIHPQQGYQEIRPLGREWIIPGGTRLGLELTAPATVNVRVEIEGEE